MPIDKELNALFYPQIVCLDESTLKYMLVLYDKIYYLPNDTHLNPGHTRISSRFSMSDGLLFGAFGTRRDAHYAAMYSSEPQAWDDDLKRLMDSYDLLEDQGVCIALQDEAFSMPNSPHPLEAAVDADVGNRDFVYWCQRYRNPKIFVPAQSSGATVKGGGLMMRPPRFRGDAAFVEMCSERINSCLYFAGLHGLVPVSNHELFIRLFGNKLQRSHQGDKASRDFQNEKRKARFSTLSWTMLAEVVPPSVLAKKTASEILRYKAETKDLSLKFRQYLFRLEAGLSSEPWDEGLRREVEKLVQTEVLPELERLREEKAQVWQELFHETLKSAFSNAHLKVLGPLLTMHLVPGLSYFDLICLSTTALVGGVFPKLLDARAQQSKLQQNALFFVLNLEGHR